MLYFDIINYLPGLLQVDDRISMAVSLEFRVPFLDYRLVRFSTEIPDNLKIKKGCQKFILRQSMKGVVPDEVLNRTDKKGFPVPLALWIRGELQPFVREILLQPHNFIHSIFNPKYIHTLWEEYLSGKTNNTGLIWSLLCLEIWHDIFICRR
jgi:asparagine synthase (glutamine-hydrolysing)